MSRTWDEFNYESKVVLEPELIDCCFDRIEEADA